MAQHTKTPQKTSRGVVFGECSVVFGMVLGGFEPRANFQVTSTKTKMKNGCLIYSQLHVNYWNLKSTCGRSKQCRNSVDFDHGKAK